MRQGKLTQNKNGHKSIEFSELFPNFAWRLRPVHVVGALCKNFSEECPKQPLNRLRYPPTAVGHFLTTVVYPPNMPECIITLIPLFLPFELGRWID